MEKNCPKCKRTLDVSLFSKDKKRADGLQAYCRECNRQYRIHNKETISAKDKLRKKQNKEVVSEQKKEYYKRNNEVIKVKLSEYRKLNRERLAFEAREYRKRVTDKLKAKYADPEYKNKKKQYVIDNAEKVKEYKKQWLLQNKDKAVKYRQESRAKKKLLPNTLTTNQWEYIKTYFNNKCAYCGKEKPLSQDHFIPLSKGGEYTHNNIIPACKSCNSSKSNSDFLKWYKEQPIFSKEREFKILKFLNYSKNKTQQLSIL